MIFSSQVSCKKTEVLEVGSSNGKRIDRMVVIVDFILEVAVFKNDWLTCIEFDCLLEVPEVCLCVLHCGASGCTHKDC